MPVGLAVAPDGALYIGDRRNHRIRKVNAAGVITTVAGDGNLTKESLSWPHGIAVEPDGTLRVCDTDNHRICKIDPEGATTTIAGVGGESQEGDGGPAVEARVGWPQGLAMGRDGSLYIAVIADRIRKIDPAGIITTIAGGGDRSRRGKDEGGPATQAVLSDPRGVAVGPDGSIYIAEWLAARVRKVDPEGIITTVAGNGKRGYAGDGGPATKARLNLPMAVAAAADGTVLIADTCNHRIRKVDTAGTITTIVGTGEQGCSGDGGPASRATLFWPSGLALAPNGDLYIADTENHRVRMVRAAVAP
jgi:DNA-binding beta-propeller fold protein YncE